MFDFEYHSVGLKLMHSVGHHQAVQNSRPTPVLCQIVSSPFVCSSPYRCNDRRTCLRRCFKEDFKALSISIANIFRERSILRSLLPYRDQAIAAQLKNMFSSLCLRFLRPIWRPGLICQSASVPTIFNQITVSFKDRMTH